MAYILYGTAFVVVIIVGALIVHRVARPPLVEEPELELDEAAGGPLPITFSSRRTHGAILRGLVDRLDLPTSATTGAHVGLHLAKRLPNALLIGAGNRRAQSFQIGFTAEPTESGCAGSCFVVGAPTARTAPELAVLEKFRQSVEQALFELDRNVVIRPAALLADDGHESGRHDGRASA